MDALADTSSPSVESRPETAPSLADAGEPSSSSGECSATSSRRRSPLNALRFVRRRTGEHWRNLTLAELSGSLGDLGTFIPLTVALARERKIALAPALFWAGVSNFITGYAWDVPMCVQPMKSIAAVALTDVAAGTSSASSEAIGLDEKSVTTAGIITGAAVLLLGATNLVEVVNWIVPLTVVCGLQVGVGLRLVSKGMRDIQKLSWGGGYDCIALALGCALLSMFWLRDSGNGLKKVQENSIQNCEGIEEISRTASSPAISTREEGDLSGTNDSVEMGTIIENHNLQTANTLPMASASEHSNQSATLSALSALSTSSRSNVFGKIWKRMCCCINPFPSTPHPVGIYLFLIGCIFAAVTLATADPGSGYDLPLRLFGAPIVINAMEGLTPLNWRQGFLQGALPQLPLTTLNSVISVCCLAHTLYPEKRDPSLVRRRRTDAVVTRREVSVSVGLMNLVLCPLGSMPNCHGAGGLAGQHRFGARHGTSVVVLGTLKILLAVFLGGSVLTLLDALPVAVLGVMIAIAGLELVGTGVGMLFECVRKDEEEKNMLIKSCGDDRRVKVDSKAILRKNVLISMVTAGVIVALQKTHYGALSGWVVHMVYGDGLPKLINWMKHKQRKRGENVEDD